VSRLHLPKEEIPDIDISKHLSDANDVRDQLASFLNSARSRVGDDGEPLITYPTNFDDIVYQMDRNDLVTPSSPSLGEVGSWARNQLMEGIRLDEGCGGKSREEEEEHQKEYLESEYAKISVLDERLREIEVREREVGRRDEDEEEVVPLTSRSMRSEASTIGDPFFVTQTKHTPSSKSSKRRRRRNKKQQQLEKEEEDVESPSLPFRSQTPPTTTSSRKSSSPSNTSQQVYKRMDLSFLF